MSLQHPFEPEALDPDTAASGPVTPGTHFRQGDVLLLAPCRRRSGRCRARAAA
jgi:hypothetical protein